MTMPTQPDAVRHMRLSQLLKKLEAPNVERTRAAQDTRKIGETICAFANDLPDLREPGFLFVGVNDDGSCAGLDITDDLLRRLEAFARDGRIVPLPVMSVGVEEIDGCKLVVVEVQPSDNPPVKFDGRVCVRRGPVRGYATPEEERRLTEKRRWGHLPFDQQPVRGSSISDLDLLRFRTEYLPTAVAPDVLRENGRGPEEQLLSLRFLTPSGEATPAGILVVGREPRAWLPGAYVQFVRYPETQVGEEILDEKIIDGVLADQLRLLDDIIETNIAVRSDLHGRVQERVPEYPAIAVQELVRNAVIHRNYEGTSTPVRISWFADRIEIVSPGGPYGEVTADTFGRPGFSAYRNPAIAEAAKNLGYVQRFGSGIPRAQRALQENGNPAAEFAVLPAFVHVTLRARR